MHKLLHLTGADTRFFLVLIKRLFSSLLFSGAECQIMDLFGAVKGINFVTKWPVTADKLAMNFQHVSQFLFLLAFAHIAWASPQVTTYQARIIKPDGYPLEAANVNFKFSILNPAGNCILFSETYASVSLVGSGGLIAFPLGSGVKSFPASSTTFADVFNNSVASLACEAGGPNPDYQPDAFDNRKIVMQFNDGTGWQTLPAMSINAVPYAIYATDAMRLGGVSATSFVQYSTIPTCAASESLSYSGTSFSCVAAGSAPVNVTSGTVVTALGYTPADDASVTAVSSTLTSVSSYAAAVSSTVYSVSSTVSSLENSVSTLQSSVAASLAAIVSSQWTTSGTAINYTNGNVGIGTSSPAHTLDVSGTVNAKGLKINGVDFAPAMQWSVNGNSGTSATTNFIGTTDNVDLVFKRNNTQAGVIGSARTAFGVNALSPASTGSYNSAFGNSVLRNNTTGYQNTGVGDGALEANTTGASNAAFGMNALDSNTSGNYNVGVGQSALSSNTSGSFNTAVGTDALVFSTTAAYNTALGYDALFNNTTGSMNTAVGYQAGYNPTVSLQTNSNSVFLGASATTTVNGLTNVIAIGYLARATQSHQVVLGNDSITQTLLRGNVGIGTVAPVTKLDVSGGVRISMESATCAVSYAGTLRYNAGNVEFCNGTTWAAFSTGSVTSASIQTALGYTPANETVVTNLSLMTATSFSAVTTNFSTVATSFTTYAASLTAITNTVSNITSSQWVSLADGINYTSGTVAIGTTPTTSNTLTVSGNMAASGRMIASVVTNANTLAAVTADFTNTNFIRATGASAGCGTLNITNTSPGGTFTITIPNATATCTTINWNGSATNVKLPVGYGTGGLLVSGVIYSFLDDGAYLWVSYVPY